ncbi:hypothetical protein [Streptomyces sp. NPDC048111]|uniref:hypothetical protein n=1 Tax=Streptomyces sp. NPDC048111 TaxID=3365500 RepID=UPI0037121D40
MIEVAARGVHEHRLGVVLEGADGIGPQAGIGVLDRRIKATVPVPADRVRNRLERGSRGGRPPKRDKDDCK